jgi:hypothetical protein
MYICTFAVGDILVFMPPPPQKKPSLERGQSRKKTQARPTSAVFQLGEKKNLHLDMSNEFQIASLTLSSFG